MAARCHIFVSPQHTHDTTFASTDFQTWVNSQNDINEAAKGGELEMGRTHESQLR